MRIDNAFPSTYLKASDLQGKPVSVVIDRVEIDTVGDEPKPILYFIGKQKGLVINKTNANSIASIYGYETDDWHGKTIQLVEAMVDFQGRSVPAIRVRVPTAGQTKSPVIRRDLNISIPAALPHAPRTDTIPDDDIPF